MEHVLDITKGDGSNNQVAFDTQQIETIKSKLLQLHDEMDESNEIASQRITVLKHSSTNPGANYYWILFVLLYGGIYFIQ